MRQGRSISEWAAEIERQASAKKDYVASTDILAMSNDAALVIPDTGVFPLNSHAHGQVAERLDIPKKYYDRMLNGNKALLAENVNTWLHANPERRMIRTLDGTARAFLSDRYRRLDNIDLAEAVMPEIMGRNDLTVASCEITERRMYLKVTCNSMELEVKKGDPVRSGFLISNSEIGSGRLEVSPFLERLVCTNGMVATEFGQRRNHVGRATESEGESYELYTDQTLKADDKAFFMKVTDTVKACLEESKFMMIVKRLQESTGQMITGDPLKAVEVVANRYAFAEGERSSFLKHLISGGDMSAWGLANAVTRMSQDVADYDKATDYEKLGATIINLPKAQWSEIAEAK
jgi:hypothetical protein